MAAAVCTETHQHLKDEQSHVHTNCHVYDLDKLEPMAAKTQVYRWDFNVFDFAQSVKGKPLYNVTMALLQDQGLLDGWLLDRPVVEAYLTRVESMYKPNPYHNNTHAADVTQTAGVIMCALDARLRYGSSDGSASSSSSCCSSCCNVGGGAVGSKLANAFACCTLPHAKAAATAAVAAAQAPPSAAAGNPAQPPQPLAASGGSPGGGLAKLERFAIILASAVHDLGHPGVNNAFLVRSRDKHALTYNDRSVNENMHASLAFTLAAEEPGLNLFARFSPAEYEQVRKLVLDMVLSTDMDVHFKLLKAFEDELASAPDVATWASLEQRSLLFQMLVHLADLANPSRPWHLALTWAEWVVTEFLQQGRREASCGLAVSDMCNEAKVCMPAAQLFFIERFMLPTLEAFRPAAPAFYRLALPWLGDTRAKWEAFKAGGVKLPRTGYPALPPGGEAQLCAVLEGSSGCTCSASHAQGQAQEQQQQVLARIGQQQ